MKLHIMGASGSGTTTLAQALSIKLNIKFFDTDDYLWEASNPPYQKQSDLSIRVKRLKDDLSIYENYVLSGSIYDWGDDLINLFDLVVFLWIPQEIRLKRLKEREQKNHGSRIEKGHDMYDTHQKFMVYASNYDNGDTNMRSQESHDLWLSKVPYKILRLEGNVTIDENIKSIKDHLTHKVL